MGKKFMCVAVVLGFLVLLGAQKPPPVPQRTEDCHQQDWEWQSQKVDLYILMEPKEDWQNNDQNSTTPPIQILDITLNKKISSFINFEKYAVEINEDGSTFYLLKFDPGIYKFTLHSGKGPITIDLSLVPGFKYFISSAGDKAIPADRLINLPNLHMLVLKEKMPHGLVSSLVSFKTDSNKDVCYVCGGYDSYLNILSLMGDIYKLSKQEKNENVGTFMRIVNYPYLEPKETEIILTSVYKTLTADYPPPILVRKTADGTITVDGRKNKNSENLFPETMLDLANAINTNSITKIHSAIVNEKNKLILVYETNK